MKGGHTPEFYYAIEDTENSSQLSAVADLNHTVELGENFVRNHPTLEMKEKDQKCLENFSGDAVAVMKLRDSMGNKVFINVSEFEGMQEHYAVVDKDCPRTVSDKKGDTSITFDVCVHITSLESVGDQEVVSILFCRTLHVI